MRPSFRRHRIPQRCHPLVRRLYQEMNHHQITVRELAQRSGLYELTISQWTYKASPALASIEACFNALGMEVTVRPRRELRKEKAPNLVGTGPRE